MGLMPCRRTGSSTDNSGPYYDGSAQPRKLPQRVVFFLLLAALFLLATACSDGLQSTWHPIGPIAEKQLQLFNVLLWVMVGVFVLVEGVLLYAIIRYRARPGQARPHQTHGHTALEVTWTIIPTILILGLGIWSVFTLFDLQDPADSAPDALTVNVTGHQWFFEFEYPDAGGGKRITTANDLRIPVDRPIRLNLFSDDVIHSFWVPKLAGKTDLVPTRTNQMWFQADADKIDQDLPATFYGQCAELCGLAHAQMRFRVTVMDQEDFDSWVAAYGPPPAITEAAKRGQQLFNVNCALCHTINGADDRALQQSRLDGFLTGGDVVPVPAPNLTDLRTRDSLGAGLIDLNVENLRTWITNPDNIKPGNRMAEKAVLYQNGDAKLTPEEIDDLIQYLLNVR